MKKIRITPELYPSSDTINDAKRLIGEAREHLMYLSKARYFGILVSSIPCKPVLWCDTFCTDSVNIYYNPYFVVGFKNPIVREAYKDLFRENNKDKEISEDKLNNFISEKALTHSEISLVLIHELMHCIFEHFARAGNRDKNLLNMAQDYAINGIIIDDKTFVDMTQLAHLMQIILYKREYTGLTSEEIYNILLKDAVPLMCTLDDHVDFYGRGASDDDSEDFDYGTTADLMERAKRDGFSPIPEYSDEEIKQNAEKFIDRAVRVAVTTPPENEALKAELGRFMEPVIDWRSKLKTSLLSLIKSDYHYKRPSKRSYGGFIFPSMANDKKINISVALDTSGSMNEEFLCDFVSEVNGIMDIYPEFQIHFFCFDTSIHNPEDFSDMDKAAFSKYRVAGRGGTDYEIIWNYLKKESIKPDQLLVFTDGEPYSTWGDPTYCDTLFIIHTNPRVVAPFGETIHYHK